MRPLTFVVGTGRTGSSALSRILNAHPDVLSLNELVLSVRAVPGQTPLSGAEFWQVLATPNEPFDAMIRSGVGMPEFLYPAVPEPRFTVDTGGIPAICLTVLPHLSPDPDAEFDELAMTVPAWPVRPAREHYRALFDLLAERAGASAVVERSGYSLDAVPWLRDCFPEARFVHMYRDGPDCAVSMSRHPGYRLLAIMTDVLHRHPRLGEVQEWLLSCLPPERVVRFGTTSSSWQTFALLRQAAEALGFDSATQLPHYYAGLIPPEAAPLLERRFDAKQVTEPELPLAQFGRLWSDAVRRGVDHLAEVPTQQRIMLNYDQLLDDTDRCLTTLARFIGVDPRQDWLLAAGRTLDSTRRGAAIRLPPSELTVLRDSCAPGTSSLAGSQSFLPAF